MFFLQWILDDNGKPAVFEVLASCGTSLGVFSDIESAMAAGKAACNQLRERAEAARWN